MLHEAERKYGPQIINYTILGVSYHKCGPRTICLADDLQMLVIQLGIGCENNPQEATFQLAHEAIHCFAKMSPDSKNTNLEEGIASYFAIDYMKKFTVNMPAPGNSRPNYQRAYEAVSRLLVDCPDSIKEIRKAMDATGQQSFLSAITADLIRNHCQKAANDADFLAQDFPDR
jgi:hypothetical protein